MFSNKFPVGSPEYNAPEITNADKYSTYNCETVDFFAASVVLFTMVMKSAPFLSTSANDPYYKKLNLDNKSSFWKIYSRNDTSEEFKG